MPAGQKSNGKIAAALDRSASTVSRELRRNRGTKVGYKPAYAHQQARARRWSGSRLARQAGPAKARLDRLVRWDGRPLRSPAGWHARKIARRISHELIYRFIYAEMRRSDDGSWRLYLPCAKSKRGRRWDACSASPVHTIANPDSPRLKWPAAKKKNRKQPADIGKPTSCCSRPTARTSLLSHERTSRFTRPSC